MCTIFTETYEGELEVINLNCACIVGKEENN